MKKLLLISTLALGLTVATVTNFGLNIWELPIQKEYREINDDLNKREEHEEKVRQAESDVLELHSNIFTYSTPSEYCDKSMNMYNFMVFDKWEDIEGRFVTKEVIISLFDYIYNGFENCHIIEKDNDDFIQVNFNVSNFPSIKPTNIGITESDIDIIKFVGVRHNPLYKMMGNKLCSEPYSSTEQYTYVLKENIWKLSEIRTISVTSKQKQCFDTDN